MDDKTISTFLSYYKIWIFQTQCIQSVHFIHSVIDTEINVNILYNIQTHEHTRLLRYITYQHLDITHTYLINHSHVILSRLCTKHSPELFTCARCCMPNKTIALKTACFISIFTQLYILYERMCLLVYIELIKNHCLQSINTNMIINNIFEWKIHFLNSVTFHCLLFDENW